MRTRPASIATVVIAIGLALTSAGIARGLRFSFGGVGSLVGALLAGRAVRRFGLGPTLIGCLWLEVIFGLLTPLAAAVPSLAVLMLSIAQLSDALGTIYFINAMSLRQSITPDRLLGRVNASIDLLAAVIGLVGALVGGLLGSVIGIQATLFIAVLGQILHDAATAHPREMCCGAAITAPTP